MKPINYNKITRIFMLAAVHANRKTHTPLLAPGLVRSLGCCHSLFEADKILGRGKRASVRFHQAFQILSAFMPEHHPLYWWPACGTRQEVIEPRLIALLWCYWECREKAKRQAARRRAKR